VKAPREDRKGKEVSYCAEKEEGTESLNPEGGGGGGGPRGAGGEGRGGRGGRGEGGGE